MADFNKLVIILDEEDSLNEDIHALKNEICRLSKGRNARRQSNLIGNKTIQVCEKEEQLEKIKRTERQLRRWCVAQELIHVSESEQIQALIFIKDNGWTGKAIIHKEELASELSKNNIPFILQVA